ncbi:Rdx family-domain-containing protein [Tuber borchii]|uniref:Rdx family-domain-containing protein n=1 Tax=Tuber borchii TaxID=42251 RepID=A0A2T6ZN03_TUBBO|nr:Rdx family-domain-containing protein [Tuber borchii]
MPPPPTHYPKITITYCTQCKWLLRAAYFAQELLSTFPTLGEVSLRPATGGVFTIELFMLEEDDAVAKLLWDRKLHGGFPEVKGLKRAVRDFVQPERGLGHVDGHVKKNDGGGDGDGDGGEKEEGEEGCVECK